MKFIITQTAKHRQEPMYIRADHLVWFWVCPESHLDETNRRTYHYWSIRTMDKNQEETWLVNSSSKKQAEERLSGLIEWIQGNRWPNASTHRWSEEEMNIEECEFTSWDSEGEE